MISSTQIDRVEADLRKRILSGSLQPLSPLRISHLSRISSTGGTPVREALSRLLSEGLVQWTPHRGFRVSVISQDDLRDIVTARTTVEVAALGLAMEKAARTSWATQNDESEIASPSSLAKCARDFGSQRHIRIKKGDYCHATPGSLRNVLSKPL
jgi:DNA-binding GntR family transcriptional regulator